MTPTLGELDLAAWFSELEADLSTAMRRSRGNQALAFPRQVARVLALKASMHAVLAAAWETKDREVLADLATRDLPRLGREVDRLWRIHRDLWLQTHKPFGVEVIEQRYGGLRIRLDSLQDRLKRWLDGKDDDIPELTARLEPVLPTAPERLVSVTHGRMKTPSAIK